MGDWDWIGLLAGLGAGAGLLAGLAIGEWGEAIGGAIGGLLGAAGAAQLVQGTLRRGGTRGGTAVWVGFGALLVGALALIPAVGYLEATVLPLIGARLRMRAPKR